MDVLKVLATKNNAFGETVVSSLLNYFLDPMADHGLGSAFLVSYLKALAPGMPFIDKALLERLSRIQLDSNLDVRVSAEWPGVESASGGRRIDSVLHITNGSRTYLIATEIKIYGRSSSDETQLGAYVDMLTEAKASIASESEEEAKSSDVQCGLAYIIPGDSRKGLALARSATAACREKGIAGVVVVPWAESDEVKGYDGLKSPMAMEAVIHDVLKRNYFGETSPADPGAVEIVRGLRNAALMNFDYRYLATSSHGQFPSNDAFLDGLEENQFVLLECFKKAAEKTLGANRLIANPLHTSIGVPLRSRPEPGKNNSLCRILTVDSYETGAILDRLVLQISKKYYDSNIEEIEKTLESCPLVATMTDMRPDGERLFHENGKKNEDVYRISFTADAERDEIQANAMTSWFASFLDTLKSAYHDDKGRTEAT